MKFNWKKCLVGILCIIGFVLFLIKINQFEKVTLVSTTGQSYEKAVVTEITKDNLAEDGNRYGTQEVRVYIKTGIFAGEEYDAVNPSGSLFGTDCYVGSKVIVIVSATDDNSIVTVYSQDRTGAIYLFAAFFALVVCLIGGKKGVKAIASLVFTFVCIYYLMFPLIYKGFADRYHDCDRILIDACNTRIAWWHDRKDSICDYRNDRRCRYCSSCGVAFRQGSRHHRIQCVGHRDVELCSAEQSDPHRTTAFLRYHYCFPRSNYGCRNVNRIHDSGDP